MANFIFAYHGGKMPESPEEGQRVMAAWNAWYEGMGDKVTYPGGPVGKSNTVTNKDIVANGGSNPLSGFTVVSAADQAAANKIAQGCPILNDGGTVEVVEILEM